MPEFSGRATRTHARGGSPIMNFSNCGGTGSAVGSRILCRAATPTSNAELQSRPHHFPGDTNILAHFRVRRETGERTESMRFLLSVASKRQRTPFVSRCLPKIENNIRIAGHPNG